MAHLGNHAADMPPSASAQSRPVVERNKVCPCSVPLYYIPRRTVHAEHDRADAVHRAHNKHNNDDDEEPDEKKARREKHEGGDRHNAAEENAASPAGELHQDCAMDAMSLEDVCTALSTILLRLPPTCPTDVLLRQLQRSDSAAAASSDMSVFAPAAVSLVWEDTTILEVVMRAVKAVRATVDAEVPSPQGPCSALNTQTSSPPSTSPLSRVLSGHPSDAKGITPAAPKAGDDDDGVGEATTTALARYRVELMTCRVGSDGRAAVQHLGAVELRQVVPGLAHLYPMRKPECLDYNGYLRDLAYAPGQPVLFTCTRL